MPVISLYWYAAQDQTSTLRRQKFRSIYSKFRVDLSEFTPSFLNRQEVAEKLQKPNNARKAYLYVFRGLRVKARVANLQKYIKPRFLVFI